MGNKSLIPASVFALLATLCYAAETVITDVKLSKLPPVYLAFLLLLGATLVALPPLFVTRETIPFSEAFQFSNLLALAAVIGLTYLADLFHLYALHRGGGAVMLSTCYVLIPVVCSVMKAEKPSLNLVLAWILGGLALWLTMLETGVEE